MKITNSVALEEDLKLFLTNPETSYDMREAVLKAKKILKLDKNSNYANYTLALNDTLRANATAPIANYAKPIEKFKNLIKRDPNFLEPYLMLAKIYQEINQQKQYEILVKANKRFPDHYLIMYDLANMKLFKTGEKKEALELFTRCVKKLPQVDSAWASLGTANIMNRHLEMAKTCFETTLSINPENLSATLGMGVYFFESANFKKAREYYEKSLMINKDSLWANFNIALLEVLEGNFEKGIKLYEKRDKKMFLDKFGGAGYPEMKKDDVVKGDNKKIVVIKEQGFGDDIMFSRYLKPFKDLGHEITFLAGPELLDLFKLSPDLDGIKVTNSLPEMDPTSFHFRTFLLSLPYLMLKHIKGKPPPLNIDMKKINEKKITFPEKIRKLLTTKKLKVGISWSGCPKHWRDINRSINIKYFQDLFKLSDTEFFVLQKTYTKDDQKYIRKFSNLHNCSQHIKDFLHTAYLAEKMDLILTVDTSIVHLAGTLGKKTYLFLPLVPDWRWGLKETQDWYPSVSLLRQKEVDDWSYPIQESNRILKETLRSRS